MMHGPLIWLILPVLLAIAGYIIWRTRSRRLGMDIQPIPKARLDNTPERSEILGAVKVRPRGESAADDCAPAPLPEVEAAPEPSAPVAENVTTAPDAAETVVSEPEPLRLSEPVAVEAAMPAPPEEPAPVALTQVDMFPVGDDVVRPARSRKRAAAEEASVPATPLTAAIIEPPPVLVDEPMPAFMPAGDDAEAVPAHAAAIARVFSLHVLARGRGFPGQALHDLLLQYGLRFGDMNIFHRHEKPNGRGGVLFSVARAHEPGTFSPEQMSRELVIGISLFMSLPGCQSLVAFDLMVDTARRIAKELGGDLLDEFSQTILPSQLEAWRDLVVDHERQRLMQP